MAYIKLWILGLIALVFAAACGDESTPSPTAPPSTGSPVPLAQGTAAPGAPAGFAQSCASGFAWGTPLPISFACVDEPRPGRTVTGEIKARGYAAGPAGAKLVIEARDGSARTMPVGAVTWATAGAGMLGAWEATIKIQNMPRTSQGSLTIYVVDSAGAKVAEGSTTIEIAPAQG